nr:immunoglobulin light chain junction region [Macaca mulatta]MOX42783.1 immunoglobulin light chain junction region [Macaca mulatta]MOX43291.1 immunoglobulin light chain junction region [Macaca mulatta]MOX43603.1 immunoglobulin light chain junction region [Macaca mulatta]MOX44221.1 immunoglobulin light chain junction region [Macaca mulatta]
DYHCCSYRSGSTWVF